MAVHRFQCRCGALKGELAEPALGVRAACYCKDCQAFARLLGQADAVLDAQGGTEVVAIQSRHVRFTSGMPVLACMSLYPKGLLRWYASCCNTPIANTPRDWKLPYASMVHSCLRQPDDYERAFPRVDLRVNTKTALGPTPRDARAGGLLHFGRGLLRILTARLTGGYRDTPFFDSHGKPVKIPVLQAKERVAAARERAS